MLRQSVCPTESFTKIRSSIDEFYVVRKRRSLDLETRKLRKVRSGSCSLLGLMFAHTQYNSIRLLGDKVASPIANLYCGNYQGSFFNRLEATTEIRLAAVCSSLVIIISILACLKRTDTKVLSCNIFSKTRHYLN